MKDEGAHVREGEGEDTKVYLLAPGSRIQGRYEVIRRLSSGGMGAVYAVTHLETKRRRALKMMLPSIATNKAFRKRFKLEATVTAEIESQHIVEIFDAGIDDDSGAPFLVMELLKGRELASIIEDGPLQPAEVVQLLWQAAIALDKTHAAGIVHRDLKPENLFITHRDDGSPCLKILDFGIAKIVAESAKSAKTTQMVGTPLYMAPEQAAGQGTIGPRADIYSIGHIAYTMLVREPYWTREFDDSSNLLRFIVHVATGATEPPSARAARDAVELPMAFDDWFAEATATIPEERFATVGEAVAELAKALAVKLPISAVPISRLSGAGAVAPGPVGGVSGVRSAPVTTDAAIFDEETEPADSALLASYALPRSSDDASSAAVPRSAQRQTDGSPDPTPAGTRDAPARRRRGGTTSAAILREGDSSAKPSGGRTVIGIAAAVLVAAGTYIVLRPPSSTAVGTAIHDGEPPAVSPVPTTNPSATASWLDESPDAAKNASPTARASASPSAKTLDAPAATTGAPSATVARSTSVVPGDPPAAHGAHHPVGAVMPTASAAEHRDPLKEY